MTGEVGVHMSVWQRLKLMLLLGLGLAMAFPSSIHAQADPAIRLVQLVNDLRLREGLPPLGTSTLLTQAAQRHADDLTSIGIATHEGTDGTDYRQRIRDTRYQAWNDGLMVNEAVWMGLGAAEDAVTWLRNNPEWAMLSDRQYREIGVGFAEDDGIRYFVVNVGSRPNVLPIFINDGAAVTDAPVVAVRLTNENAVPMGEGTWMGRAIEVRLSNSPDFEGIEWQPWESLLPWLLADIAPGDYAVYVEFRDGAGRTTVAEDTIRLVAPGEMPPTPTPFVGVPAADSGTTQSVTGTTTPGDPTSTVVMPSPEFFTETISSPSSPATTSVPDLSQDAFTPFPTWTPLSGEAVSVIESSSTDWPLLLAFALQGAALLLGIAAFLRRR